MKMFNLLVKYFLLLSTSVMLVALFTSARVEAATCTYCHQEIVNSGITVEGKPFHVEHFMCANCLKPIGEEDFYRDNGRYFDRNCYENFITDKCKYCLEPIIGKYIIFESEIYHLACFDENIDKKCLVCNESAVGGINYTFDVQSFFPAAADFYRASLTITTAYFGLDIYAK